MTRGVAKDLGGGVAGRVGNGNDRSAGPDWHTGSRPTPRRDPRSAHGRNHPPWPRNHRSRRIWPTGSRPRRGRRRRWPAPRSAASCQSRAGGNRDIGPEGHDFRIRVARRGSARSNPLGDHPIFQGVGREPRAAAMLDGSRWLQQQETFRRPGFHDTATKCLPGQDVVIGLGRIRSEREPQPVFPGCRAMAGARVAPQFRQDRLHMVAEAPGYLLFKILDRDRRDCFLIADRCHDPRRSVPDRSDRAIGSHGCNAGVVTRKNHLAGSIGDPRVSFPFFGEESLRGLRPVESGRGWLGEDEIAEPSGRPR